MPWLVYPQRAILAALIPLGQCISAEHLIFVLTTLLGCCILTSAMLGWGGGCFY